MTDTEYYQLIVDNNCTIEYDWYSRGYYWISPETLGENVHWWQTKSEAILDCYDHLLEQISITYHASHNIVRSNHHTGNFEGYNVSNGYLFIGNELIKGDTENEVIKIWYAHNH